MKRANERDISTLQQTAARLRESPLGNSRRAWRLSQHHSLLHFLPNLRGRPTVCGDTVCGPWTPSYSTLIQPYPRLFPRTSSSSFPSEEEAWILRFYDFTPSPTHFQSFFNIYTTSPIRKPREKTHSPAASIRRNFSFVLVVSPLVGAAVMMAREETICIVATSFFFCFQCPFLVIGRRGSLT